MSATPTLYALDVHGVFVRLYYALPMMRNAAGEEVGALYGFAKWLLEFIAAKQPAFLVACYDAKNGRDYRRAIYPEYKANRPPSPDALKEQLGKVRELVTKLGVFGCESSGFEADDVLATLVRRHSPEMPIVVVSGDKDLMQLVRDGHVTQFDPAKETTFNEAAVADKLGVRPHLVGELLALMGDDSDNIPGVPKVGAKTAAAILNGGAVKPAVAASLALPANQDARKLSRRLVELQSSVPLACKLGDLCYIAPEPEDLAAALSGYGFDRLAQEVMAAA